MTPLAVPSSSTHAPIEQLAGAEFPGTIEYESGSYVIELAADGTTVGTRDDWSFRVSTAEGSLITQIASVDEGVYTVEGDIISVNSPDSEAEVTLWVEQNGVRTPVPSAGHKRSPSPDSIPPPGPSPASVMF